MIGTCDSGSRFAGNKTSFTYGCNLHFPKTSVWTNSTLGQFTGTLAYFRVYNNATLDDAAIQTAYSNRFQCKSNYYGSDGLCHPCPSGSISASGSTSCSSSSGCKPGHYSSMTAASGSTMCTACEAGKHTAKTDSTRCDPCIVGRYAPKASANCRPCSPGTHSAVEGAGACKKCSAGRFAPHKGAIQCRKCALGKTSKPGFSACLRTAPP